MRVPGQNTNSRKYFIIILFLMLFHIINNFMIMNSDKTPLLWDGSEYFCYTLDYYDVFTNIDSDFIPRFYDVSHYRPPLFLLSSLPLFVLFGVSTDAAVMTNIIYLVILVSAVYGIGKRIHSEAVGVVASFIVTAFPIIYGLSRAYWLDFSLTAMVALSIYLLFRTDYFRERKYSILFGVSVGLGMLTKWTYFVFITGPFLYFLISSFKGNIREDRKSAKPFVNAALSIVTGAVVASLWYIPNILNVVSTLFAISTGMKGEQATRLQKLGESIGPQGIFNLNALAFYPGKLVNEQSTFFFVILFIVAVFFLIKSRNDKNALWPLLLWFIVPLIAFTLIKNKTARNTVPMLPAVALMISLGITCIKTDLWKKIITIAVLSIGLIQYVATSYGSSYLPQKLAARTFIGEVVFFQQYENASYALFKANTGDWQEEEIFNTINADRGDKLDVKVALVPRDSFTWKGMEYYGHLRRLPFTFIGLADEPDAVLSADYVINKKGGFVAPWFVMHNVKRSLDLMQENQNHFVFLKSFVLPEKQEFLSIYNAYAPEALHKGEVVFSNKLKVLDYTIDKVADGANKAFTLKLKIGINENIKGGIVMLLKFMNKRFDVLMMKEVNRLAFDSITTKMTTTVQSNFTIPERIDKDVYSIEMSFYDPLEGKRLTYQPEYLVYKRI